MLNEIWQGILNGASNSSPIELFAALTGLISVWLTKKENILLFPIGILSVGTYVFILWEHKLYADMSINAYYFIMNIYGWVFWSQNSGSNKIRPITRINQREKIFGVSLFSISALVWFYVLTKFTDSDVAMLDSITTSFFIVAMIWMARKKFEHWWAWIFGDLLSIPLYIYKGLAFTAAQYLIFCILAVWGLYSWKKSIATSD